MSGLPRSIEAAKAQAKALRAALLADGHDIAHSAALEMLARSHGLRDWNTLHARIGNRPQVAIAPGDRVTGHYLKQPFTAEVLGVTETGPGRTHLVLHLDQPVDVVTFESFSNLRRRVQITVGPEGRSFTATSDGTPHLVLDL